MQAVVEEITRQGFKFIGAFDSSLTNGRTMSELILIKPPAAAIFLQVEEGRVQTLSADLYVGGSLVGSTDSTTPATLPERPAMSLAVCSSPSLRATIIRTSSR